MHDLDFRVHSFIGYNFRTQVNNASVETPEINCLEQFKDTELVLCILIIYFHIRKRTSGCCQSTKAQADTYRREEREKKTWEE